LANLFPLLEDDAFAALVADIKRQGLLHPIITLDGSILDGRNRYQACIVADIEPQFIPFTGSDPLAYVISANLQRRHLTESQRAMVAARLETMKQGRPEKDANWQVLRADAARMLNVSPRSVARAAQVRDHAVPELAQRVEDGTMAVSVAAKIAKFEPEVQRKLADEPEAKARTAVKREKRAQREQALAEATIAASQQCGSKLYGVIYADPPWRFEPYSRDTGMDRAADNHYPTMTAADICAIAPPAAADCALFLWATVPMLREAFAVIDAWGFHYKSHVVWDKLAPGTGYWFRNCHELLLLATRGAPPAPAPGEQYDSIIGSAAGAHSEKPTAFAEMIEEMFPHAALLEMFARRTRAGWDVWGNEVAALAAAS
jgi:N6-adenosine-specific RNA methylase IME4